jgi:hypothetical protein
MAPFDISNKFWCKEIWKHDKIASPTGAFETSFVASRMTIVLLLSEYVHISKGKAKVGGGMKQISSILSDNKWNNFPFSLSSQRRK